jgi:hypothetical protein
MTTTDRPQVPVRLSRLNGQYQRCDPTDADYLPSDLLSILRWRWMYEDEEGSELRLHYRTFSDALARALGVSLDARVMELLRGSGGFLESRTIHLWLGRRRAALTYADPWGSVLEGDIWGHRMLPDASAREALDACIAGYLSSAEYLADGVLAIDRAICLLVGWNPDARVPASVLRDQYGVTTQFDPMDYF